MKPRSKRQTKTLLTKQASTHKLTRGQSIHFEFVVFFHDYKVGQAKHES